MKISKQIFIPTNTLQIMTKEILQLDALKLLFKSIPKLLILIVPFRWTQLANQLIEFGEKIKIVFFKRTVRMVS